MVRRALPLQRASAEFGGLQICAAFVSLNLTLFLQYTYSQYTLPASCITKQYLLLRNTYLLPAMQVGKSSGVVMYQVMSSIPTSIVSAYIIQQQLIALPKYLLSLTVIKTFSCCHHMYLLSYFRIAEHFHKTLTYTTKCTLLN